MNYTCLLNQEFEHGIYKIVPVRQNDRHDILKWRNEQIFHLRQQKLLSSEEQDSFQLVCYFPKDAFTFEWAKINICLISRHDAEGENRFGEKFNILGLYVCSKQKNKAHIESTSESVTTTSGFLMEPSVIGKDIERFDLDFVASDLISFDS